MGTEHLVAVASLLALATACTTGRESFVGGRLANLCNETFFACNVTAGCLLDGDHYVEGLLPGARRVMVRSELPDTTFSVRLYLDQPEAPGTEFLVQLYEPDCTLDTIDGRVHWEDVDVIDEAGQDRTLLFELFVEQDGEHLLELFSDASTGYLLIAEPI